MGPVIDTNYGRIEGIVLNRMEIFLGVPYARPPVGELRFRPPRPPEPWTGSLRAQAYGAMCPQPEPPIRTLLPKAQCKQSEGCLTLNVWTPSSQSGHRPILVWLHPGMLLYGSGADPVCDGDALARRGDLVVVTLNYRLGVLGYLHHPQLHDPATGLCGNWGVLDQLAALQWVRDHAERLGGDPDNVTLFGSAAGGASVATLATSPLRRGLFRRAIAQSTAPLAARAEDARAAAETLADAAGCSLGDPDKLRELPVERLLELQGAWMDRIAGPLGLEPVGDGKLVAPDPIAAAGRGATAGVDLLIGTNRDEYRLYGLVDRGRTSLDLEGLQRRLSHWMPASQATAAIDAYRTFRAARAEPCEPWDLWCAIQTDRLFRVPALRFAAGHAASGLSTYVYLFNWESPFSDGTLGACHGLEIPFVFGSHPLVPEFAGASAEAYELAERIQDAWIAFARCGNPTHPGIEPWPRFDLPRRGSFLLDDLCRRENAPREPERAFWD
jgi:para-nitrobenzyl esterase